MKVPGDLRQEVTAARCSGRNSCLAIGWKDLGTSSKNGTVARDGVLVHMPPYLTAPFPPT